MSLGLRKPVLSSHKFCQSSKFKNFFLEHDAHLKFLPHTYKPITGEYANIDRIVIHSLPKGDT